MSIYKYYIILILVRKMGKIFCIIGKSSSGKDTLYRKISGNALLGLLPVIPYTTRPIRSDEADGREYFFTDESQLLLLEEAGKVIEARAYHTLHGIWKYFTADDGQIDLAKGNYLIIATIEAYVKIRDYFGAGAVVPLYLETDDGLRLQRALAREMRQEKPKYAELCRRFLADMDDFSEEKLRLAGIDRRFRNVDLAEAEREITEYIRRYL